MITYQEMVDLFERANAAFLKHDKALFANQVSERTLCGALMLHIHDIISRDRKFAGYHADVEYNRNKGAIKTIRKTIKGPDFEIIPINCDLIVHSRGEIVEQDNLIAIEMKKATATCVSKEKDRERLIALTKDSFDDVWSFGGKARYGKRGYRWQHRCQRDDCPAESMRFHGRNPFLSGQSNSG